VPRSSTEPIYFAHVLCTGNSARPIFGEAILSRAEGQSKASSAEGDRRLELLHTNIRKYGTISNTVTKATKLEGTIRRAS